LDGGVDAVGDRVIAHVRSHNVLSAEGGIYARVIDDMQLLVHAGKVEVAIPRCRCSG
jgi:hypothetical protein